MYWVEVIEGEGGIVTGAEEPINPLSLTWEDQEVVLSLHALNGGDEGRYNTMNLNIQVGNKHLTISIDSGSTHNFLDLEAAKKLGCRLKNIKDVRVRATEETLLTCPYVCKGFKWKMHGVEFCLDTIVLTLGHYDMISGVQWLRGFGRYPLEL